MVDEVIFWIYIDEILYVLVIYIEKGGLKLIMFVKILYIFVYIINCFFLKFINDIVLKYNYLIFFFLKILKW